MEAKQSQKPFEAKSEMWWKNKGELTHMDLWGKYDVIFLQEHQYYLLLIDNVIQYVTLYFLKGKHGLQDM